MRTQLVLDASGLFWQSRNMDSNEREIYNYLQTWGNEFVSAKEISRRAGTKKRYHDDPDWAKPYLQVMTERGLLERDMVGRFRVKPKLKKAKRIRQ